MLSSFRLPLLQQRNALDEEGTVWYYNDDRLVWCALTDSFKSIADDREERGGMPEVSKEQLLEVFERMCKLLKRTSRGFDVDKIDGPDQWAIKSHSKGARSKR